MSTNLLFASPLHIEEELSKHQVKCAPHKTDLIIVRNGGICAFQDLADDGETATRYVHDPIPGLRFAFNYMSLQGHIRVYGSAFIQDLRKRIGHDVALEILSRTGSIACRDSECDHKWIKCPLPSHVKSALMHSYDPDVKDSVEYERQRQEALFTSGFAVHVHREQKNDKKRRTRSEEVQPEDSMTSSST